MRKLVVYLFFLLSVNVISQQTIIYNQTLFNIAGMNPSAAGANINEHYNYIFGVNRQWVAFDRAPKSNFANFSITLRPERSYHYWQNVGIYIDAEQTGFSNNNGVYFNYTYHLLLRKNLVGSFGVYVGGRQFFLQTAGFDRNDPTVQKSNAFSFAYPDIIPGFRISNKKFFFDISARQLSITKRKDFQQHQIGSPSKLYPSLFISYGKLITLSDKFLFLPSITLNTNVIAAPALDANTMFYYANTIGFGFSFRNTSFLSTIFQVKVFQNLAVGFAYSYPLNSMRYVALNNFEIMMGVIPIGLSTRLIRKHAVAKCPALDF